MGYHLEKNKKCGFAFVKGKEDLGLEKMHEITSQGQSNVFVRLKNFLRFLLTICNIVDML